MLRKHLFLAAMLSGLAAATATLAAEHMFSYDPANAQTRALVDNGLTFVFEKSPMRFRVTEVLATQAKAKAALEPAGERELGASLNRLLPERAVEHDLYRITDQGEGPAMVHAFCPGSTKGWLVFGGVKARRDLVVHVLGDDPAAGKAKLCATLSFTYRGEWNMPNGDPRRSRNPPYATQRF